MMVEEKHYDDDSLIALASASVAMDEHLTACSDCRERLETYRLIAEAMADETTWNTRPLSDAPVPETIANLRGFADRMAIEDAEAAQLLPNLLVGPREQWMSTLHHHSEYRTAGMVRKLLEAVPTALDIMPRDAVELTALAIEIADNLETATPQLRGAAWRERAYALFYTGDFVGAEKALCASERHFTESVANEYDLARVGVVRALVERGLERYTSAIGHARESARLFRMYEDKTRNASARLAEVNLLLISHQYDRAYTALVAFRNELCRELDSDAYGRVLANLGYCCWKLSRSDEALHYLDAAAQLFEELGVSTEATRARWNAARVLAAEGRINDALPRLRAVVTEVERTGMMASATEASLEIAELLLATGAFDEANEICRVAMRRFEQSNLAYTVPALTALALMSEAVRTRTATRRMVQDVREYLRQVPDQPTLLFAFRPE
ncbi:MAG: hypothetical protein DMF56_13885 [Acidobacteria bacterium]|nr:MAG: hypothetical protein DMF56_13885 [Acidobacteriota bacterium]